MNIDQLRHLLFNFALKPESFWGKPDFDYPPDPRYVDVRKSWHNKDGMWSLSVTSGRTRFYPTTCWWDNGNNGGNICHQGLLVHYAGGDQIITRLAFSTVASESARCYTVEFDMTNGHIEYFVTPTRSVNSYRGRHRVEEFDSLVLDLITAMLPAFMVRAYRRTPKRELVAV